MSGFKLEPGNIVNVEPVEESDFCEHLKAIESHELVDLLVEDFFQDRPVAFRLYLSNLRVTYKK